MTAAKAPSDPGADYTGKHGIGDTRKGSQAAQDGRPSGNVQPAGHSPTIAGVIEGGDGLNNGLPSFSGGHMGDGSGRWGPTGHCHGPPGDRGAQGAGGCKNMCNSFFS